MSGVRVEMQVLFRSCHRDTQCTICNLDLDFTQFRVVNRWLTLTCADALAEKIADDPKNGQQMRPCAEYLGWYATTLPSFSFSV